MHLPSCGVADFVDSGPSGRITIACTRLPFLGFAASDALAALLFYMVAAVTWWRSGKVALAPISAFILRCALLPFAVAGASACATGSVYTFQIISQEVLINRASHKKLRHNAVFVAVEFGILLQKR